MRMLVVNTKGGVGKSTVAQQVLVPFIYERAGQPIKLVDIDELNFDSAVLGNSGILERVFLRLNQLQDLAELLANDNLVIDTGGNLSGEEVLKFLNESGLIFLIDLFVIPLTDGEQDSVNAVDTMNKIKKYNPDSNIVFALNRVKNIDNERDIKLQFPAWCGFEENDGYRPEGAKEFYVPDSLAVKYSRRFGITVYEIANQDIDVLKKKLLEATKEKNTKRIRAISDRIYLINKSRDFVNSMFRQLEKLF